MIKQQKKKEDYRYHISVVQEILASVFSDKIGCRDNNLYDGGHYYVELYVDYIKKDFEALGRFHSDRN